MSPVFIAELFAEPIDAGGHHFDTLLPKFAHKASAAGRTEDRAEPGTVAEGDYVSWGSSGGRARGRIDHVMDYGRLDVPGTDFAIDATEDDPAALITVYEEVSGGWRPTDTQVGHKVSTLTKIDALPEPQAKPARRRLPVAKRDCGTGAGGFKPGNKCGKGGGGADSGGGASGGGGDSSGSPGGSVEQAKPGDGPLVKAARDEHKKALDRLRKNIEAAEAKGEAKFQKAADEYFKAKDAHYDIAERAGKLQEEHALLGQKLGADPNNETLKSQFAEATRRMEDGFSEMEASEKVMRKADAKREKARQEMRAATAIALRKEVDAVNKEDDTEPRNRARVEEMMSSPDRIASDGPTRVDSAVREKSIEIAARPVVAQEIKTANEYALRVVNPEMHGQAMTTPISFEESVRAYASVRPEFDHHESRVPGSMGSQDSRMSYTRLSASDSASTHLHEMAHHIEYSTPEVRELTADFLESRTRGEQSVAFSEKFPRHGYSEDERGSPDDFKKAFVAAGYSEERAETLAHYAGKRYDSGSTEVLTMGIELMYRDAKSFAAADPEWFDLVAGITTGRILTRTRRAKKSQVPFKDS